MNIYTNVNKIYLVYYLHWQIHKYFFFQFSKMFEKIIFGTVRNCACIFQSILLRHYTSVSQGSGYKSQILIRSFFSKIKMMTCFSARSKLYMYIFISAHRDNSLVDVYLTAIRDFNVIAVQPPIQRQPHSYASKMHCRKKIVLLQTFYNCAITNKNIQKPIQVHYT